MSAVGDVDVDHLRQYKRWYVRVCPLDTAEFTVDPHDLQSPDFSLWLMDYCMDDHTMKTMGFVRRTFVQFLAADGLTDEQAEHMATVHLRWAMQHPMTPYGFAFRRKDRPGKPDDTMTVVWKGDYYRRDQRGVLTPLNRRISGWLTDEQFYAMLHVAKEAIKVAQRFNVDPYEVMENFMRGEAS
jgi:hypothetical protein